MTGRRPAINAGRTEDLYKPVFLREKRHKLQPCILREPEHQIHILYSLPRGTFDQIIQRADRDHSPGALIDGEADIHKIGTLHPSGLREVSFLKKTDEVFIRIIFLISVSDLFFAHTVLQIGITGREDAPVHRNKMGREIDQYALPVSVIHAGGIGKLFLDLRRMAVRGNAVGFDAFIYLTEKVRKLCAPARSGRPGLCVHDDGIRINQLFLNQGIKGQDRRRGIAAGIGDNTRGGNRVAVDLA